MDTLAGQTPLVIIHSNTLEPSPKASTCEFGKVGDITMPGPAITFHEPTPTTGMLPARVAVPPVVAHIVCDGPALDAVGKLSLAIDTVADEGGQTPLLIVHWKIFIPTPSAVMPVVGEFGEVIVPAPEINVQLPVPTPGRFPAMV